MTPGIGPDLGIRCLTLNDTDVFIVFPSVRRVLLPLLLQQQGQKNFSFFHPVLILRSV
ncbi:hypothetical protein Cflav_PD5268 [Pedosphaera parvula Ellin514]|uniref:Uncharacterized protein n=1 Tax=Pedosphaera parvula (strain Ellin514) TaxID=320771 RepID=B9XCG5_PEDPL|nr:hypothetical protein Cflav_PD0004 [Pedosphaera parvula Ellin514]EEF58721.1 hypothetical protein Cflav_PD1817 [Pedosphaera parvula Ellin514]EEF59406.1 hypothetical protein Cflav_PD2250 [Pedosphaera parvula Ellin514]EEF61323.1 hypothetical protein Cflav_PD4344 [Pedosphaera parvula Ellin514]EEF62633.1 hypothetical protein Cflav_PD5268 [Pedosphaera parvula Ellin514]